MPHWDYHCSGCGSVQSWWFKNWEEAQRTKMTCGHCGQTMERLWSAPSFTVKGHNAKNGYSQSKDQ